MRFKAYALSVAVGALLALPGAAAAQAESPKVDRLAPLEADQSAITNPVGAAVHFRHQIDRVVCRAAHEAAIAIKAQCSGGVLLVDDPAQVVTWRAMRQTAQTDFRGMQRRLSAIKDESEKPQEASIVPFANLRVAPGLLDAVRLTDATRFVLSLARTQYRFDGVSVSPTPGLLDAVFLQAVGNGHRFGEPISINAATLSMFEATRKQYQDLAALLAEKHGEGSEEEKKRLETLIERADAIGAALARYEAPGADGQPSLLQSLAVIDYSLPEGNTRCLVSLETSADVMSIQGMRIVPKRNFDIHARAVVVVNAINQTDQSVIRHVVSADDRAVVRPADGVLPGTACALEEKTSVTHYPPSGAGAPSGGTKG
ncbi:hypothetical protein [Aquimonas voraii]|uniref:Uncharacterized protein n=1 Tax=Aquimonas voraii TaxID=265719 RepID=A0A1G6ZSA3_9GAMM|nr:hypothetical protein [Aquimonas voraii]SDE05107.1 hypothetical protein SAMN04488509_11549 [Aquimonas voraii]